MNNIYDRALSELLKTARNGRIRLESMDEAIAATKKLTVDNFFKLLYSLFNNSNMLMDPSEYGDVVNRNKFAFTEIYPDYPNGTFPNLVLTYEIFKRGPAVNSTKVIGESITQVRPTYMFEVNDITTNDLTVVYSQKYETEIKFTCWSEKSSDANRLASTIENFFIKNYHVLRKYIDTYQYKGRGQVILSSDYGNKRLFGVPLVYCIRTDEIGYIRQSEITSIDVDCEIVTSSELEELRNIS